MDPQPPPYTYDDDLIEATRADKAARVRVYRLTDTIVVLGAGSTPDQEVNLHACRADGVPVLKRRGGGCAVVIDPGNVIVSVTTAGLPFGHHRRHFDRLTAWLIDGLARTGIPDVKHAGICDLVLGDRKIAGACLHRSRDLLYYSASLLVEPDLANVARYLKHPPREPDYRRKRPHEDFMGSIAELSRPPRTAASGTHLVTKSVASKLREFLRPPELDTAGRS
ncbi:MAG: hypothetical protein PVI86_00375 [Phycisphaerae bacterium]